MKPTGFAVQVVASCIFLILSPTQEGVAQCTQADSLRDAGALEAAVVEYAKALDTPGAECVTDGLTELAQKRRATLEGLRVAQGDELRGEIPSALKGYVTAFKNEPDLRAPRSAILDTAYQDPFAGVKALKAAGMHKAAALELKDVLKKTGSQLSEDSELKSLTHPVGIWWNTLWKWPPDIVHWLTSVFFGVLLIVLARLLYRFLFEVRLDVDNDAIGDTDSKAKEAITALLEQEISQRGEETDVWRPELMTVSPTAVAIPDDIRSISRPSAILSEVIKRLTPRVYTSRLLLRRAGKRGVGITVVVSKSLGNRVVGSHTFWQADYRKRVVSNESGDQPEAYYDLVVPVATWLLYQVAPKRKTAVDPFAENWVSAACFRTGVHWRKHADSESARHMFESACEVDPQHAAAKFNLAVIRIEEQSRKTDRDYSEAKTQLTQVLELLDAKWPSRDRSNGSNYLPWNRSKLRKRPVPVTALVRRTNYQLAAVNLYENRPKTALEAWSRMGSNREDLGSSAVSAAIIGTMIAIEEELNESQREHLLELVGAETREWPLAGVELAEAILSHIENECRLEWRDRYNLACAWSILGNLEKARANLERALSRCRQHVKLWALHDPSLAKLRDSNVWPGSDGIEAFLGGESENVRPRRVRQLVSIVTRRARLVD